MSINAQKVYDLAKDTGFTNDLCKIALDQTKDFGKAKDLLNRWTNKPEDTKVGISKVFCYLDKASQSATLIRLSCDTQNVLMHTEINSLASSISDELFKTSEYIESCKTISKLEKDRNCAIGLKFIKIYKSLPNSLITIYNHKDMIVSLVETVYSQNINLKDFKNFSFDCAMHVAAFNPLSIHIDEINPEVKKQFISIVEKDFFIENKPMQHWGAAGESRYQKWAARRSLLTQLFIKSETETVGTIRAKLCEQLGAVIDIKQIARLEVQ